MNPYRFGILFLIPAILAAAAGPTLAPPALFTENRGQAPAGVRYLQRSARGWLGFSDSRISGQLATKSDAASFSVIFPGARPGVEPEADQPLAGVSHVWKGADESRWLRNLRNYGVMRYRELYPGIDLEFHSRTELLEYDFVVAPGGDPARIRMAWEGEGKLALTAAGELAWESRAGRLVQRAPVAYQEIDGVRRPVAARFVLAGGEVRFAVGDYDRRHRLVIDPVITYASYLGGTGSDYNYAIAVDAAGNIYLAGSTTSPSVPVGRNLSRVGLIDCLVTKLSPTGDVIYSTAFGGIFGEEVTGIAVDGQGSVYFSAYTQSPDFPVKNARQSTFKGGYQLMSDAVIGRLNPQGNDLVFATFWGGVEDDEAYGVTIDGSGNVYATGYSVSNDFPFVSGSYQTSNRGYANAWVSKLSPDGQTAIYSTMIGGSNTDYGTSIAVDATGAAYVTGYTSSNDFPRQTPFQQVNRGGGVSPSDAFISKLNPAGKALVYSSFFGGDGEDQGQWVGVGSDGSAYVAGLTSSATLLPVTAGAYQTTRKGAWDGFVFKVTPQGNALTYATYIGGNGEERLLAGNLRSDGSVDLGGWTSSTDMPVIDAVQSAPAGNRDGWFGRLDAAGAKLLQSSYLGGSQDESVYGIAVDTAGKIYLSGDTASPNLPTVVGALQQNFSGGTRDAFLVIVNNAAVTPALTLSTDKLTFAGAAGATMASQNFTIRAASGTPPWTIDVAAGNGGTWLAATPRSGAGTATIDVTATPGTLAAGSYTGTITVTNTQSAAKLTVAVTMTLTAGGGSVSGNGVVNAASYAGGGVAPGELVTIFGTGIGPSTLAGLALDSSGRVATTLADTTVTFDGTAAPLVYVSATQVSAIVPYGVAGKAATQMQVSYKGLKTNVVSLPVVATAPALFTYNSSGKGGGAILNQNGSVNTPSNPAAAGDVVVLYGTGEGATDPVVADGTVNLNSYPKPTVPVTVRIGGKDAVVEYSGAAPGLVAGVFQINVRIPSGLAAGNQPVVVTVGAASSSPEVTVALQ